MNDASISGRSTDVVMGKWRRGLVCTVRPGLLVPLAATSRRMTFVTRKRIALDAPPDYRRLHARVETFARARQAELRALDDHRIVTARTVAQGWDSIRVGDSWTMAFAALTVDFTQHETPHEPLRPQDFSTAHAEELKLFQDYEGRRFDELYVDFDFAADDEEPSEWVLSFGEYVDAPPVDVAPFMEHAESRAAFYAALSNIESHRAAVVRRREWNVLRNIGKKIGPDNLVDIWLYYSDR